VSRPTGIPEVRGLPREPFTAWAAEHLPGLGTGWRAELVSGGLSNLTYRVRGPERTVVVRRPPVGKLLPSAHDVGRERRVMAALRGTPVPVPEVLGGSEDPDVLGAPFFVMAEVKGVVYREPEQASSDLTEAERDALCTNLFDVLAAIHAVDLDATGMRDFGKPAGYLERQVRRWSAQWDASHTRELRAMDELVAQLDAQRPPEGEVTLVHGDYRHDNTLVSRREGHPVVAAVVDWELSTLGDPLADLATWLTYWTGHDEAGQPLVVGAGVPTLPGFPTADEVARRYAAVTGRDVTGLGYYRAFTDFRLAVIAEGVHARYLAGIASGAGYDRAGDAVPLLVERALTRLG
jgi:aminoglycoside phosphotransferase (APT) family kinase protein